MSKSWPNFQASFFFGVNGNKTDQLVIRADEKEEFETMMKWVKAIKAVAKNGDTEPTVVSGAEPKKEKCQHPDFEVRVTKNGKNQGKKYKKCIACGEFLGWTN